MRDIETCLSIILVLLSWVGQSYFSFRPTHVGKVFKIFIMTKDEWPTIVSNALHHGHVFGFNNIHVVDGSADQRQIDFLNKIHSNLGVSRYFSSKKLNDLAGYISNIMLIDVR